MLALAVSLVPLTLAGAFQGALLGHRRFVALGAVYVATALARLAAGVLTALAGWGVTGAFWTLAAAAALSTGFGWLLTGPRSWRPAGTGTGDLAREVVQACSTVAGILVLTNTDVLLARHYLDAETSGAYGVASLFAKAMLWGSQFVVQAAYPALAAATVGAGCCCARLRRPPGSGLHRDRRYCRRRPPPRPAGHRQQLRRLDRDAGRRSRCSARPGQ